MQLQHNKMLLIVNSQKKTYFTHNYSVQFYQNNLLLN